MTPDLGDRLTQESRSAFQRDPSKLGGNDPQEPYDVQQK